MLDKKTALKHSPVGPPAPRPKHPNRRYKDEIFEQIARLGKAVSSPKRLELLDLLCQGPRSVDVLAREASLSMAATSMHLQNLRAARLVEAERAGLYMIYSLTDAGVCEFYRALRSLAAGRLAEIEQITRVFLDGKGELERVERDTLLERMREGSVVLLDVRPPEEYRAGHIAGALSVPLSELERRLGDLPPDCEFVAYCRGPYCVLAMEAVALLSRNGRRARRLTDGYPDWRASGFPVEVPPSESAP
jgi:rhodanese-related sulfurtransferase